MNIALFTRSIRSVFSNFHEKRIKKHYSSLVIIFLFTFLAFELTACKATTDFSTNSSILQDSFLSPKLLNSERIMLKYGSYAVEVLSQNSNLRVSNLYSSHDQENITRTFSVVNFPENMDTIFLPEHQQILNGGSIGQTFKSNGWEIEKKNIYLGEIPPAKEDTFLYNLMGNITPSPLALYSYSFNITKNEQTYVYATISEVYHPDYLSLAALKVITQDTIGYSEKNPLINQLVNQAQDLMNVNFSKR